MQPDGRQSFIQRLKEPAGWLSSDLALGCTVSPRGTASADPLSLSEESYCRWKGRVPLLQGLWHSGVRPVTAHVCLEGRVIFCWPSRALIEMSKQHESCFPAVTRGLQQGESRRAMLQEENSGPRRGLLAELQ